jgi:hypothetical protein
MELPISIYLFCTTENLWFYDDEIHGKQANVYVLCYTINLLVYILQH